LALFLEGERTGVYAEPELTFAAFLLRWLVAKETALRPSTVAGYHDNVRRDLTPAFGHLRLTDLRERHIETWTANQQQAGRGSVIVEGGGASRRGSGPIRTKILINYAPVAVRH
jgi:hypothetical protein